MCILFRFQSCDLHFMLFFIDVDLMNVVASECGLLGFKDETKHLLDPSDPSQAPFNPISK